MSKTSPAAIYEAQHIAYSLTKLIENLPSDSFDSKDFGKMLDAMDIVRSILNTSRPSPELPPFLK